MWANTSSSKQDIALAGSHLDLGDSKEFSFGEELLIHLLFLLYPLIR
jgi:hypothetical protein